MDSADLKTNVWQRCSFDLHKIISPTQLVGNLKVFRSYYLFSCYNTYIDYIATWTNVFDSFSVPWIKVPRQTIKTILQSDPTIHWKTCNIIVAYRLLYELRILNYNIIKGIISECFIRHLADLVWLVVITYTDNII